MIKIFRMLNFVIDAGEEVGRGSGLLSVLPWAMGVRIG